ncbi:MAG: amidophosphoribosyltransferase [Bacillota bacterium]|jgi:amidophosphoribosyltransferase|nr:amidophosphoribosyltransferase [Bacillota bacterium]NLU55324.1 amidophosphoribosyltransferase [Bacillota bacterium]HOJ45863.1 amidophosphoribosyltransferase [Bacillota bacterium]HOL13647.1 amidophosphoribosyltransferase [Bacillota bacterium]HPQ10117.1 amidophosphoribosyltransferase [Bacillota bacterium]
MYRLFAGNLNEECGVLGVYGVENAKDLMYYGLHTIQHRGQEGAGIVTVDKNGVMHRVKGMGLVTEVFNAENLRSLSGDMAIGHVHYTVGNKTGIENIQPFLFHHYTGDFAICHNGSVVNSNELRRFLEDQGSIFQSTSDSEILAHLIKREQPTAITVNVILEALNKLEGAFAYLIMTRDKLYCCRDKHGLRPLSIGTLGSGYVVSSETCVFEVTGAKYLRDVEPGEVVVLDREGLHSYNYSMYKRHYMCAMEFVYFSRPDSDIEGLNVHTFRKETGKLIYRDLPVDDADIVIGVPDSSLSAAIGYAEASGVPYEMGLIKSKYIGRTFIQPSQELREKGVRMKLSAVPSIVKDKKVVLIDDSIVRGTTSKRIVRLLREAGAKEVHVRIASPQLVNPCFYGVDTTSHDDLICRHHTDDEVCKMIGADSLAFLSVDALYEAGRRSELCTACFDGNYPTQLYSSIEIESKKESEVVKGGK